MCVLLKMDCIVVLWCLLLSVHFVGNVVSQQQKDPEEGLILSVYSFFSPSYLVSYPGDVNTIKDKDQSGELEKKKYIFNYSSTDVTSIAVDTRNQSMYYIDRSFQGLYRLRHANVSLKSSAIKEEQIHQGISSSVGTVAFDWISNNLYWTDRYHNWIAMRPANNNDPLMYRIVLEIQIIVPVGLAIDPINRSLCNGEVSAICVNTKSGAKCMCQEGYRLQEDKLTCKDPEEGLILSVYSFFSPSYLVSYPGDVNTIKDKDQSGELEKKKYIFNYSSTDVTSIAVDTRNQSMYYIDRSFQGLYRLRHANVSLKSSAIKEEQIHQGISSSVGTVAFDWISNNLYWTDRYHNWIAMRPANNNDPLMYRIVLEIQIIVPVGLAIDPINSYMFWSDTMPSRRIERSSLLGENRTVLLSQAMEFVISICTDHVTKRIYWVDYLRETLETATYDGLDRKVIRRENNVYLTSVALFKDYVCVTDNYNSRIACLDKDNDHCATVKCQQFCVNTKSGAKCMCQEGYRLQEDKLTCKGMFYDWVDDSILWSEDDTGSIKRVYLKNMDFDSVFTNIEGVSYLTANPHNRTMYWISGSDDSYQIEGGSMAGFGTFTVLGTKDVKKPSNLFYDEIYEELYFVDEEEVKNIKTNGSGMENRMSDYVVWTNGKADIRVAFVLSSSYDTIISLTEHKRPCEDGNGGCQHICIHTRDSYVCQCPFGFKLAADGKKCRSDILKNNYALISDSSQSRIYQIPTDKPFDKDSIVALDIPSLVSPHTATYDTISDYLYWADMNNQKINRVKMTGENETNILTLKSHYPDRIVFDMSTGNLYFTAIPERWFSEEKGYIGVLKISRDTNIAKHRRVIQDLGFPSGLALYPKKGLLFWGDTNGYIGRSYMSGENVEIIITDNIESPLGLAIDYKADRLYWVDFRNNVIKSATLDGTEVQTFISDKNSKPTDLKIHGSYLFYIGWNKRSITKVNLLNGRKVEWMQDVPELGKLDINEYCSIKVHNHGCSTFCLPKGDTAICACEDGVNKRDNRHCANVCKTDVFEHVKVQSDCVIREGGKCNYTCTGHLSKNKRIPLIQCFPNGTWNQPERNLCSVTECSTSLPDVYLSRPCSIKLGDKCMYSCKDNTLQKGYTSMKCSSGGIWVPRVNRCKAPSTLKCSANLKHGKFASNCSRFAANTECKFTCDDGYVPLHVSVPIVGLQTADQQAIAVGGGLGAVAIIMIIIVVVLLVCFLRKRTPKQQDQEILEPESINVSRRGSERQSYPKSTDRENDPSDAYVTIARTAPINAQTQQKQPTFAVPSQTASVNARPIPSQQVTLQTAPLNAETSPRPQAMPQTTPLNAQAYPGPEAMPQTTPFSSSAKQEYPTTHPGQHKTTISTSPGTHKSVLTIGKPGGNPYESNAYKMHQMRRLCLFIVFIVLRQTGFQYHLALFRCKDPSGTSKNKRDHAFRQNSDYIKKENITILLSSKNNNISTFKT
ncbi:hypothetical protein KUTeg_021404 [Tegillarca granosa]|uniref:Sushi domain-containing protein n=1 Tax=Tegillarca granosa TaxID=220873 RepID=A0ABQ9E429_TEGGR|nr:hypothetical protein KUTeg_021404 [Tegillarca granosa]